jgi:hypothetical protein
MMIQFHAPWTQHVYQQPMHCWKCQPRFKASPAKAKQTGVEGSLAGSNRISSEKKLEQDIFHFIGLQSKLKVMICCFTAVKKILRVLCLKGW